MRLFIIRWFDKLEDRIRAYLSRRPLAYALLSGSAIVLFWRSIWLLADNYAERYSGFSPVVALLVSVAVMLLTGTFVSFFIGDQIIISGMRSSKRTDEKTEEEIRKEVVHLSHIDEELELMRHTIDELIQKLDTRK